MADSDGEYVADDVSDDDLGSHPADGRGASHGTRSAGLGKGIAGSSTRGGDNQGVTRRRAAWEDIQRSWDTVIEGADGSINSAVDGIREAGKRQRLLKDTTPLQRGIIRHLVLILDLSSAMVEKDLRPTRNLLTIRYATLFITEFFEQNPISQLGIIGMRDGLAVRISDLSGNPIEHLSALSVLRAQDPRGSPSLQNGLEMSRAALYHAPTHGTREILIIYGALLSSDPGDIHKTIRDLVSDRIRVSIIGLAARVAICDELCSKTNPGNQDAYHVALDERHFFELFMDVTTPPVTRSMAQSKSSLLMMGFPSRTVAKNMTLCACHSKLSRGGYLCSRCGSKVCALPAECPACGLTLILSTHLARSYHHLFPLDNWLEVSWSKARVSTASGCFACGNTFPKVPSPANGHHITNMEPEIIKEAKTKGMSESGRYACRVCHQHFCIDCDVYAHEVVHNCPGCQSDSRPSMSNGYQDGSGPGTVDIGNDNDVMDS